MKNSESNCRAGSSWRRYNHDGYGQRPDGGPYKKWGKGRLLAAPDRRTGPLRTGGRRRLPFSGACHGGVRRRERSACRNSYGTPTICPKRTCIAEEPAAPQCRWSGRIPSTFACFALLTTKRCSTSIPEVERRYLKEKPKSKFEFWMPKHPIKFARQELRSCACARRKNFAFAGRRIPGRHGRIPTRAQRNRGGILRLIRIGSRGRSRIHVLLDIPRCMGRTQSSSRGET